MSKLSIFFAILFSFQGIKGQDLNYAVLEESLIRQIEDENLEKYSIYVLLEDRIDLDGLQNDLAAQKLDIDERAPVIIKSLQDKAKSSQRIILNTISDLESVDYEGIHTYWISNSIFFECGLEDLKTLSHNPLISWIGLNSELQISGSNSTEEESFAASIDNTVEPGLIAINAPAMWELGYTGYGQLALVADTGIDPTHPAYNDRYRGNTNGDAQAWFQGDFFDSETPFNCGDHGTHVLGTVLGLDRVTNDTIGVAFNAQWMGSPNLCFGTGTESNLATFQWGVDPDGNPNTTEDMADVINNSWWDPGVLENECNSLYIDLLQALEMMGVVVVFSAGNAGSDPMTITPPHNININEVNSFTVAAIQTGEPFDVADFSSRGPSQCGGEGSILIKPEVAAPGIAVRSAVFEKGYGNKSGTSMAAPHVSGAILLLKEAFPDLSAYDLKWALYSSCRDLGEEGEDNAYGQGLIDVKAAYDYLVAEGNEPVPPVKENDVILMDVFTSKFECDGMLTPEFVFFNDMNEPLTSFSIEYFIDDNEANKSIFEWEGFLEPYASDQIVIPGIELEEGFHKITASIIAPNGLVDSRPINNLIQKSVFVSSTEQLEVTTNVEFTVCQEAKALVEGDFKGAGEIQWFDEKERGTLLGTGDKIDLILNEDITTIWGDVKSNENAGPLNDQIGTSSFSNREGRGLEFNALHPFVIESFRFYSEDPGIAIIILEAPNGDQLYNGLLRSDGSGWQTFDDPIKVPESRGLRLVYGDGTIELAYNTSGSDYPYAVKDVMEISGATSNNQNRYYFFYDLEISYLSICGRTPVEIEAVESEEVPVADFSVSDDELDLDLSGSVSFADSSMNAVSWFWDFDDGNTSLEQNPTHEYDEPGLYYVSLIVENAEGCYDSEVKQVNVFVGSLSSNSELSTYQNDVRVFPNPFSGKVNVSLENDLDLYKMEVHNTNGKLILTKNDLSKSGQFSFSLEHIPSGLYYIQFYSNKGIITKKIVKR